MLEDEKLRERLAQLQSTAASGTTERGSSEDIAQAAKSLQQRLHDLSGRQKSSGDEGEFHSRFAALTTEDHGRVTSAEELAARFSRLGEGSGGEVGSTGSAFNLSEVRVERKGKGGRKVTEEFLVGIVRLVTAICLMYKSADKTCKLDLHDQDVSGDFQDLDDLLADALEGDDNNTHGTTQKAPLNLDGPQLDQKLNELEAAATAETAKNAAGAAAISEEPGLEADALEAFLYGRSRIDRREEVGATVGRPVNEVVGDDEERLLQMMTDQVRLEGHGIINNHETKPSKEKEDELWLPLAPTTTPVMPRPAGGTVINGPGQNNDAARLIAQQAMDEARLGLSTWGGGGSRGADQGEDARRNHEAGKITNSGSDNEEGELWCCLCSDDAVLRCRQCEEDNEGDEPELLCSKCSKEVHRCDPRMRSHRPNAVSRRGGRGRVGRSTMEGFKQGLRDWKR